MFFTWILLALTILTLLISFICYRIVFFARPATPLAEGEYDLPPGKAYAPFHDAMRAWQDQVRALPYETFTITSFDGLKLSGKYYEYAPGAVTEIMFHGYRGSAMRDLCGGVHRAFRLGRNVLLVDQRTSNQSQGNTITFGIREHRDCLDWVEFLRHHFGPDTKLILTGISMGAATVLMATGEPLPPNVVGVLADCGYSSPKAIIQKCAKEMKLPPKLVYPFIRLGARLFGHFDPDSNSPLEAVKRCRVPVIFFHGQADDFVPSYMSQELFDACASPKKLVIVPNADHGLSFPIAQEEYLENVAQFFTSQGVPTQVVESVTHIPSH